MAESIQRTDSIESSGFPLGFTVRKGPARPGVIGAAASRDMFRVELRALGGHQKEAVVTEGEAGSMFRNVCDEGALLKGTDLREMESERADRRHARLNLGKPA